MLYPAFIPDWITAGLLFVAIAPWLAPIFKAIEVGGLKLELRLKEVEEQQNQLSLEVQSLRFLVSGFVTDWEIQHLRRLQIGSGELVPYSRGPEKGVGDRFVHEIIRLRDLGLISKKRNESLWDMELNGNLSDYVELTDRGRFYLKLRSEVETEGVALGSDREGSSADDAGSFEVRFEGKASTGIGVNSADACHGVGGFDRSSWCESHAPVPARGSGPNPPSCLLK